MKACPLYNGENLNFTGKSNPYGLIQSGGKRRVRKSRVRKSVRKNNKRRTRKYRR